MVESVNKITAYRDGQEREFTQKVWDAMGIGHCGWAAVPEVPKEVSKAVWVDRDSLTLTGTTEVKLPDFKPRKTRKGK